MLATVADGPAAPRFVARFGYRPPLVAGLVLLGAPALVLPVSGSTVWITAVCAVRGLGFEVGGSVGGGAAAPLLGGDDVHTQQWGRNRRRHVLGQLDLGARA
jgi:MFS family permease